MTRQQIDRAEWRKEALGQLGRPAADPRWPGRALHLLDALDQAEARIVDTLALCDEWAAMGTRQMSIGAVRRALEGAAVHEATALGRAEARIKQLELGDPDRACGRGPCCLGAGHPGDCRL